MATESYKGEALDISFDTHKCIHARNCVLSHPGAFKANFDGPWIDPNAPTTDEVVATLRGCPSGALTYTRTDGGANERAPAVNRVQVLENGPLAVRADIMIDGKPAGFRAVLCRCGASKHKPFCDHSHAEAGFQATGEPVTKPDLLPLGERGGKLMITPQKNGSLKVEGPLELTAGTGRRVDLTTKVFLCRCGHSANKPYCDSTHKRIGFTADGA
jgi:CDGSH-type Zn-finger protein/uncharacterized Fe-S cluster protein YjdI